MVKTLQSIIDEVKKYLTDDFTLEDIYWIIEETLNIEKYQIFSKKYELFDDVLIMERVKKGVDIPVAYILNTLSRFSLRRSMMYLLLTFESTRLILLNLSSDGKVTLTSVLSL